MQYIAFFKLVLGRVRQSGRARFSDRQTARLEHLEVDRGTQKHRLIGKNLYDPKYGTREPGTASSDL